MKRIVIVLSIVLATATAGWAADWESRLPGEATQGIRAGAGEMVRSGVDPDTAVALVQRMTEQRFPEAAIVRALEMIAAAQKEGLPADPIVNKAYEGMAKKVDAEGTLQAMAAVRTRYAYAFRQAETMEPEMKRQRALGTLIAEGLTAAIQEKDMSRLTEQLRQSSRDLEPGSTYELELQSVQTARDMARLGARSETAVDVVCQALQHRFTARDMEQMRNAFLQGARYGQAESMAERYGRQIRSGSGAESLGGGGQGGRGTGSSGTGGMGGGSGSGGSGGGSGSGGGRGSGSGRR